MGKVATAATTAEMKRKKKGRPSKNRIPLSAPLNPINLGPTPITYRRSVRRNPKFLNSPPPEFDDDDDDERKEKKVKLVVRLPQSDENSKINQKQQENMQHSQDDDSASESGSDSGPESEDRETHAKKRKINAADRGSDDAVSAQEKEVVTATDTPQHGSPLESGPTTPLPDKKLLVFILDRLQKKDSYRVFSEPVDINELPDYFEIIETPMDFGTVRKKLDGGAYKNLEELEADVFLICSNAMLYNAPDTIYYRQARSMQDLAKRDFENLRHEGDNGEPQPKVVRRGRPPSNKNQKKSLETSPVDRVDRVGPEPSPAATLTGGEDKATGSNSYNLRKGPGLYRFRSTDPYVSSYRPRNGENYSEWLADWNDEFPASILRADMKYGKKQFTVDENRRDTYRQFHPVSSSNNSPFLTNSIGDMKRLVPVGLHEPLAYARSLARFAANLGPVAWKIASKKIEYVLPPGLQYGPGWVGDNGAPSQPLSFSTEKQKSSNSSAGDCNSNRLVTPSASDLSSAVAYAPSEGIAEAVRKLNNQNEAGVQGEASSWKTPFPPVQQRHTYHQSQRNGFSGMFGYDTSAVGTSRMAMPGHSTMDPVSRNDLSSGHSLAMNNAIREEAKLPESWSNFTQGKAADSHGETKMWNFGNSSWPVMQMQQQSRSPSVPPDLNVRIPAGSPPSSNLQIGSPQQPDLALQL